VGDETRREWWVLDQKLVDASGRSCQEHQTSLSRVLRLSDVCNHNSFRCSSLVFRPNKCRISVRRIEKIEKKENCSKKSFCALVACKCLAQLSSGIKSNQQVWFNIGPLPREKSH